MTAACGVPKCGFYLSYHISGKLVLGHVDGMMKNFWFCMTPLALRLYALEFGIRGLYITGPGSSRWVAKGKTGYYKTCGADMVCRGKID